MIKEDKGIVIFLLVIAVVLVFTFTAANKVTKINQSVRKRTDHEMLTELRAEYNALMRGISGLLWEIDQLRNENRLLRDMLRARIIYEEMKNAR